ncbi:MAG TPA: DNA glycosylase [Verrucomicrobiae bacterium]|nr:DNA glycosylase [Verrucomicrobiae bacterium]
MAINPTRWGETPGEPWWPSAKTSRGRSPHQSEILLRVRDYDLDATLDSGQAFRWHRTEERGRPAREFRDHAGEPPALLDSWTGIIGTHQVRLTQTPDGIHATTAAPVENWDWLRQFLQTEIDLAAVLKTFPDDEPMRAAVAACPGLRLLKQDPWECLASFILSSTKQIVQIRQIIALLCERFGEPCSGVSAERRKPLQADECGSLPKAATPALPFAFPTPQRIAACTEAELRDCKMGFRAPSLLAAAREIAEGRFDLERIRQLPHAEARAELMKLRGVGGKIADCVLLFACGFDAAFPVDVWIERALQRLYFPRRRASEQRLRRFAATHFGPHAGYAQQYLFHYIRTKLN